jgi:hypothetical protein
VEFCAPLQRQTTLRTVAMSEQRVPDSLLPYAILYQEDEAPLRRSHVSKGIWVIRVERSGPSGQL